MNNDLRELQEFLKALASETRQNILFLFAHQRELTVGEVAERAGIGQSTASENLSLLKRAGVLHARRVGKTVFYTPNEGHMLALVEQLRGYLTSCCRPE